MKRSVTIFLVVLGLIAALGCAQKKVATAPEQPAAPQPGAAQEEKTPAAPGTGQAGRESVTEKPAPPTATAEQPAPPKELPIQVESIHFDYDKYDIREDAQPILKKLAALLSSTKGARVIIEGHCDERGTDEYNLALGDRRANAAREYLVALGIPSGRIETVSYGEEKPLCAEGSEECWARNRRAAFVLVEGK